MYFFIFETTTSMSRSTTSARFSAPPLVLVLVLVLVGAACGALGESPTTRLTTGAAGATGFGAGAG
jgi:hypothetical protein